MTDEFKKMNESLDKVATHIEAADTKYASKEELAEMREAMRKLEASSMAQFTQGETKVSAMDKMMDNMRVIAGYSPSGKIQASTQSMSINIGPSGGYLAPPEFRAEVIRRVKDTGGLRGFANVISTTAPAVSMPIEMGGTNAYWLSEKQPLPDSTTPSFGMREYHKYTIGADIRVTSDLLADPTFNMEAYVIEKVAEATRVTEDMGLLYASGANNPDGLLTSNLIPKENHVKLDLTKKDAPDELIMLTSELPASNSAAYAFYMTLRTFTKIRTMKVPTTAGVGAYAFEIAITEAGQRMLNGFPVNIVPSLPSFDETDPAKIVGGKRYGILFGDMKKAYNIVDDPATDYIIDPLTQKRTRVVEYTFYEKVGGGVLDGEQMLKVNTEA